MPSHRADTPAPLRRPRENRSSGSKRRPASRPTRSRTSLSAPQVGIAGALGIATIAAPISGAMANAVPKAAVNQISAIRSTSVPAFPILPGAAGKGVEALSVVPAVNFHADAPTMLAAPRTVIVSRASRSGERSERTHFLSAHHAQDNDRSENDRKQ